MLCNDIILLDILLLLFKIQTVFILGFFILLLLSLIFQCIHGKVGDMLYRVAECFLYMCAGAMVPFFAIAIPVALMT